MACQACAGRQPSAVECWVSASLPSELSRLPELSDVDGASSEASLPVPWLLPNVMFPCPLGCSDTGKGLQYSCELQFKVPRAAALRLQLTVINDLCPSLLTVDCAQCHGQYARQGGISPTAVLQDELEACTHKNCLVTNFQLLGRSIRLEIQISCRDGLSIWPGKCSGSGSAQSVNVEAL